MDDKRKNLSEYDLSKIPVAKGMRIGMVVSEWNNEITFALRDGAVGMLKKHGVKEKHITIHYVPGSFELPHGAQILANTTSYDAVICIGCVIQGETRHFEFICSAVAHGITEVALKYNIPVVFGVLTPDTWQQAKDRAGGIHGNKGDEAAITAIKMIDLNRKVKMG